MPIAAPTLPHADSASPKLPPGSAGVSRLSGGERTRLALTAIITRRPDCVLLDEPTNHLDDQSMELLEGYLVGLPGIVGGRQPRPGVPGDRVCTEIIDLEPGRRWARMDAAAAATRSGRPATTRATWPSKRRPTPGRRYQQTYRAEQQGEITELRGGPRRSTPRRIAHDGGTKGQRQVHLLRQGPERREDDQPSGPRHRASHRRAGERPGSQAPEAARLSRSDRPRRDARACGAGARARRPGPGRRAASRRSRWRAPARHRRQRVGEVHAAEGSRRSAHTDLGKWPRSTPDRWDSSPRTSPSVIPNARLIRCTRG